MQITKTYNVYKLEELTPKAQEKARAKWAESNEYYFLSDYLNERLHELLEEKGIKDLNDTSKAGTRPTQVLYSLGYSQGDGACFRGEFLFTYENVEYTAIVTHSSRYYHAKSVDITILRDGSEVDATGYTWGDAEEYFKNIYEDICTELEAEGYNYMEYEDSMERFQEVCDGHEYMFLEDGTMFNA